MIFCNSASHQRFPRRAATSCPSRTVRHLWWDAERASWEGCRCAGSCRRPRGRTRSPIRVVEQVLRLKKPVLSRHLNRTALFNRSSVQHLVSFEEEWRKVVNSSCILQLRPSTLWSDLHPVFTMWAPMEEISSSKSLDGLESVKMWTEDPATGSQVFNNRGRCEAWFFSVSISFDKLILLLSFCRSLQKSVTRSQHNTTIRNNQRL